MAKRLDNWDKKYLWHPFTQMKDWLEGEPLIIEEAKGSYLKDSDGRWYLDGVSSLWVNVHGHRKKEIDISVARQLSKVAHSTLLGLGNIPSIELAREIIKIAPKGLAKVFYSDNGSTAVEIALKMAYQYWQHRNTAKTKFIHLENAYHGDTVGSVSVGGIDLFHKAYKGLLFDSYAIDSPYCYRCPKKKIYPLCGRECLGGLKEILECDHSSIAALIVEPLVQAASGMLVWPDGIYKEMSELCKKYNVLLIADEVAVGMGRTGSMFASDLEGVTPDILCVAKGITGGYLPLAATLTTQNIFDGFLGEYKGQKTFFHGHTYTGNPLACAAARANLELFKKEKTLEKLKPKIQFLKKGLEGLEDGRKRFLFILLNFLKNTGYDYSQIEKVVSEWNKKNTEPLRDNYINAQISWHKRQKGSLLPPNCDNQQYYPGINICNPDGFCKFIKNPVHYSLRKKRMENQNKKKGKSTKKTN